MTEYVEMWKNFSDFSGRTSVRGYWMAFLVDFLVGLTLGILGNFISVFGFLGTVYYYAVIIPEIALFVRRMHDADKSWANIFWILLPVIGWIVIIVKLCSPSATAAYN